MVDTVTTLIEKAITTDNDSEALACIKMARRQWKGSGSVVMPRRPANKPEDIPVNTIKMSEHLKVCQKYEQARDILIKDNNRLGAENDTLRNAAIKQGIDDLEIEVLQTRIKSVTKQIAFIAILGWAVALFMMVFL